ncbi:MAG: DUF1638 domain-containing protein [Rhizobiaceae bacterium]
MTSETDASLEKKPKLRVIACGMIAREVLAVNQQLGYEHIDLKCLPASYHHHPEKIAPHMDLAIQTARDEGYEHIFVGYADCGTSGELDKICEKHGVERVSGPHCFSFYMGNQTFLEAEDEYLTTFFLTDFIVRHFETFMKQPLGLDKHPELLELYFANYTRALYLAQTKDPELEGMARAAADFLGLEYEYRFTGYGDLTDAIAESA